MINKITLVGLIGVAVMSVACTSVKNSPGYRGSTQNQSYQQMADVRELDASAFTRSGLSLSSSIKPRRASYQPSRRPAPQRSAPARNQRNDDVELILGPSKYYRSDVEPIRRTVRSKRGGVALNFERASVREVVGVILGDILKKTYIVEPGVEGEVTINSSAPIPRDSLIPTLESLLQTQGAVLYRDDTGGYRVAARSNLKGRGFVPSTGKRIKPGYSIQVVPLRYIPAAEMQKILEPLASPDAFVRIDNNRNLLVLAGTSSELRNLLATIETFDVDVLRGMSVGLFKVKNVEAQIVAKNLDALFGESGNSPMAGMIKIMPIEHMNSIMIISASPDYLREMKRWVDRFDQTGPKAAGQQLYVYSVQNGDAEHLAQMLSQIFSGKSSSGRSKGVLPSSLAPGLEAASIGGNNGGAEKPVGSKTILGGSSGGSNGVEIDPDADVKIVADKTNNSLMILSSERMYQQILSALKRIDIMPLQVQVEASILEVTLNEGMEHGLKWYFENDDRFNIFGSEGLGSSSSSPGGFSFKLAGGVKGVISALANNSEVKVISSPSVLVLDHQTANIRVGDQQPIRTGNITAGDNIDTVQTLQFKDTGVSLQVTPHVNSNGLVKMELVQDITDVGDIDDATGQRSFLQRNIKSNIAVQSGETIVLGGLIRENRANSTSGVPVLRNLPVLGHAFKGRTRSGRRTELLVLITPTVAKNQHDLDQVGQEMRKRMKRLMDNNTFVRQLRGEYVE